MNATQETPVIPSALEADGALAGSHSVFVRQGQRFGLPVEFVREVIHGRSLTRIPRRVDSVAGVLNLRGDMLPVVLVDQWLELPFQPYDPARPIVVLRQGELLVGIQVDAVQRVASIPRAEVSPSPSAGRSAHLRSIWNVAGQPLVTLIDAKPLLAAIREHVGQDH